MCKFLMNFAVIFSVFAAFAQPEPGYWQQQANYEMQIDMDVKDHTYKGTQKITYTNNSPDTLTKVYYHLYFNAFQPNSEMDVRSLLISDPDKRVGDRISKLLQKEIGYIKVNTLSQNGTTLKHNVAGTVLEVQLATPITPGAVTVFEMDFKAQVPKQIRRSGRDNKEGVALSMTQWFPKLAEYDVEGWHADPYIGREFHGVWGDYDVHINIDSSYTLGGSGVLQNANEIGHGYAEVSKDIKKSKKLNWHFIAENVHDFTWAADPEYIHDVLLLDGNKKLHFLYKNNPKIIENWKKLQPLTKALLDYYETHIGPYPYPQYSVIQGGDGGMEYAMCTLITGERKFESLFGVTAHEMAHAWFQHLLATNEAKYEWMDEGFTTYISNLAENEILVSGKDFPNKGSYDTYKRLVLSGVEQPQTTHADRYSHNFAYGASAYGKGAVFLAQLGYIVGDDALKKIIKEYYKEWKFKHPRPNDFKRIAEKVSGLELDWYLTDWTQTTNTIDYGIKEVTSEKKTTKIIVERKGLMPMPIEVKVVFNDGAEKDFYIPLQIMRGEKEVSKNTKTLADWAWAYPTYDLIINKPKSAIKSVSINPSGKMADVNALNDVYTNSQP